MKKILVIIFLGLFLNTTSFADKKFEKDLKKISKDSGFVDSKGKTYSIDQISDKNNTILIIFNHGSLNDQKIKFNVSDFQKSERDFAFIVSKDIKAQDLINAVSSVDQNLISNIKVFDVYEGENIPKNQKSIAISVTIQSSEKTLNDSDLENINNLIIKTVENKTGAKIRS